MTASSPNASVRRVVSPLCVAFVLGLLTISCGDDNSGRRARSGVDRAENLSELSQDEMTALCLWTYEQLPSSQQELRDQCVRSSAASDVASPADCESGQDYCIATKQARLRSDWGCKGDGALAISESESDCATITVEEYESCIGLVTMKDRQLSAMTRCEFAGTSRVTELFEQLNLELPMACDRLLHDCQWVLPPYVEATVYWEFFR